MTRALYSGAFLLGAAVIVWIAASFVGSDLLALLVTLLIGGVYIIGGIEQWRFRQVTNSLTQALQRVSKPVDSLSRWLEPIDPNLQNAVRLRIEGERLPLPGPVLSPYLVGLLVMLGLLGTFIGMVVTLKGAVMALEGTTELQAIRSGLARPIEGLGLAFGTSVAGVAASAMLGLISTLNRRDRMLATRELDSKANQYFQAFSQAYQRQEAYKAMQRQAEALPSMAERLGAMADKIESMGSELNQTLVQNQQDFQSAVTTQYQGLADSVEKSLKDSLVNSTREASEQVAPVIQAAMSNFNEQAEATQQRLISALSDKIEGISRSLENTNHAVADAWQKGIQSQQTEQSDFVARIADQLKAYESELENRSGNLWEKFEAQLQAWADGNQQQQQQLTEHWSEWQNSWQTQLEDHARTLSSELAASWQKSAEQNTREQGRMIESMASASSEISRVTGESAARSVEKIENLLQTTEQLVESRIEAEQASTKAFAERTESLVTAITEQLARLSDTESSRGEAAVARLAALEEKVAEHLGELGQSLEAPMMRLIDTASEAPKAAAQVIEQLRGEISRNVEKDNAALEERVRIMEELNRLLSSLETTTQSQREAIEQLITHSSSTLEEVSSSFANHVNSESDKLTEVADQFVGSVAEIASLGESFNTAVSLFSDANQNLIDNLVRIEAALEQSSNRSDEQLAYYVAQAREIIDHNIMSQKEIFEHMRQVDPQAELIPSEVD